MAAPPATTSAFCSRKQPSQTQLSSRTPGLGAIQQRRLLTSIPQVTDFLNQSGDDQQQYRSLAGSDRQVGRVDGVLPASARDRAKAGKRKPAVTNFRSRLALTHNNIGRLQSRTGRRTEAMESYRREPLGIEQKLADDNPAVSTSIGVSLRRQTTTSGALDYAHRPSGRGDGVVSAGTGCSSRRWLTTTRLPPASCAAWRSPIPALAICSPDETGQAKRWKSGPAGFDESEYSSPIKAPP